jgi:hypothetical protein
MWQLILSAAVRIALWAASHPDEIKKVIDVIHAAKEAAKEKKAGV